MYFLFSKAGNFETSITRVPYNKLLTNLACSSRTGEYWLVQQTKQAIQLVYANRIIYSHILLFDLEKRTKYISETEQDPLIHKRTGKTIN